MATNYQTPGVYIEEIPALPQSVAEVQTAIPAFIGYTQKALDSNNQSLTLKPTRITSVLEFVTYFGGAQPEQTLAVNYVEYRDTLTGPTTSETINVAFSGASSKYNLYYAIQAYYDNGGGPCYIVSIGGFAPIGSGPLGATDFRNGLQAIVQEDEPTLIVFPEGQGMLAADHYSILSSALDQCGTLQDRFTIMDLNDPATAPNFALLLDGVAQAFRNAVTPVDLVNLKYGAAYFPNVSTSLSYVFDETQVMISHKISVNNVLSAGAMDGKTLASLDPSISANATPNAVGYNKFLQALDAYPVILPPSPLMAGIYATVDNDRGVWKAPANVGVADAVGLTYKVTNEDQDGLNVDPTSGKSINAIRAFTGRGILVWGARTLAGNDNEWRYVNVRRFFTMVEQSCKLASASFVFENNDANTWAKLQGMIENFLTTLWRQGALQGAKPDQAFYVSVGLGKTMTALDILEGRLIVQVGLAAVRPAEFIILQFIQMLAQS